MPDPTTGTAPGPETPPLRLHACGGGPPPQAVAQGWQVLLQLPGRAQQEMTELVVRSVVNPGDEDLAPALEAICRSSDLTGSAGMRALRACQFLLTEAAARDLDAEPFMEDLEALSGEATQGLRLLGTRYPALKARLREHLLHQSLTDHGTVLVDLDWRVDVVQDTSRAQGLNSSVIHLTLELETSDGRERVTMQLPPRSVRILQDFTRRFQLG